VIAAIAVIAGVGAAPAPGGGTAATASQSVSLPPTATTLVCPPPPAVSRLSTAAGTDAGFTAMPSTPSTALNAVSFAASGAAPELTAVTLPEATAGAALPVATKGSLAQLLGPADVATALRVAPAADATNPLGAIVATTTTSGDLEGLAVSSCDAPTSSGWLVGGGVEVGRSGRIVLSNPGRTTVSVGLTVLTTTGAQQPAGGQDLVIGAGASREVLLEALVGPDPTVAVGFTARGGAVSASIVDTQVKGIVARGVEFVPTSLPAITTMLGPLPENDADVTLRLANPSTHPAQVNWRMLGGTGTIPTTEAAGAAVAPGHVLDIALTVPSGARALTVTSDVEVLAAAQVVREHTTVTGPAADRAWLSPTHTLDARSLVVRGPGVSSLVLIGGEQPATVVVRQVDANGAPVTADQTVAVAADSAQMVVLDPSSVAAEVTVRSADVHAGLLVEAGPGSSPPYISAAPVQPAAPDQSAVSVRVTDR
jgi:hypothetical protein